MNQYLKEIEQKIIQLDKSRFFFRLPKVTILFPSKATYVI